MLRKRSSDQRTSIHAQSDCSRPHSVPRRGMTGRDVRPCTNQSKAIVMQSKTINQHPATERTLNLCDAPLPTAKRSVVTSDLTETNRNGPSGASKNLRFDAPTVRFHSSHVVTGSQLRSVQADRRRTHGSRVRATSFVNLRFHNRRHPACTLTRVMY